ncbi:RagB/SusD family nutrient uptake outer membrane protein [Parafilimonas sp.]|uniref:RagB/SusD family nutrient uptake outer membrane protein n=1 Tax=Parafilimonas sp. TaxID=1969739 RepID=UPI0039E3FAC4
MKKYINIIMVAMVIFTITSCNKQLDLQADGRISLDNVFNDYNQVRGYLNSCYGYCPAPYMDRASYTDEAEDADDITAGSKYSIWYGGNVTSSDYASYSSDGSPWTNLYIGIRKCNTFIEGMKTAQVIAGDDEKEGWVAQAKTLRALYYLQLIKRYGSVPLITTPYEIDHDFSTDKKSAFSEVVAQILTDCNEALAAPSTSSGFPWEIYDNQFGIMSRAVPYAIMSQAITYAASPLFSDGTYTWQDALDITAEALYQCSANGYELFDVFSGSTEAQNVYATYFLTSSNDRRAVDKETIYQCGTQMQVWKYAGLPSTDGVDKAGPCPTQDLIDAYEMANGEPAILGYSDASHLIPIINPASGYDPENPYEGRDPRFYASIYYNGALRYLDQPAGYTIQTYVGGNEGIATDDRKHTRTGYYMRKFNSHRSGISNESDGAIRLFRYAELLMNFAEAAYQTVGPDAEVTVNGSSLSAREAVNMIRARAGMPELPAGLTTEEFETRYRNERRIEFAFEEHRFFDVRRWKILDETDQFVTGMRITKSASAFTYTRFKFTNRNCSSEKWLLYPIDQSEVYKMMGLTGEDWQNPDW